MQAIRQVIRRCGRAGRKPRVDRAFAPSIARRRVQAEPRKRLRRARYTEPPARRSRPSPAYPVGEAVPVRRNRVSWRRRRGEASVVRSRSNLRANATPNAPAPSRATGTRTGTPTAPPTSPRVLRAPRNEAKPLPPEQPANALVRGHRSEGPLDLPANVANAPPNRAIALHVRTRLHPTPHNRQLPAVEKTRRPPRGRSIPLVRPASARPTPSRPETAIERRAFRIASFPEVASARKASGVCVVRAALIAAGVATSQPHPQPQYAVAQTPPHTISSNESIQGWSGIARSIPGTRLPPVPEWRGTVRAIAWAGHARHERLKGWAEKAANALSGLGRSSWTTRRFWYRCPQRPAVSETIAGKAAARADRIRARAAPPFRPVRFPPARRGRRR